MSLAVRRAPPFQKGFLKVSDGHRLYVEVCGNRKGVPFLFLHGGPGMGFSERSKARFDLRRTRLILFDQRGAGRSRPFASLRANTTPKLVADINRLLDFLKLEKVCLYGSSWGSTLALAYAIRHPHRVLGLVIAGIFLGSRESIRYYIGGGVRAHFPDAWEKLVSLVPPRQRHRVVEYYLQQMQSATPAVRRKFAFEWAYYETTLIAMKSSPASIARFIHECNYQSLGPLEAHYMKHHCFLPDNYILRRAHRLSHLPVSIINGRYDMVCPPQDAYALHQQIRNSRFAIVYGGHITSQGELNRKIRSEIRWLTKTISKRALDNH